MFQISSSSQKGGQSSTQGFSFAGKERPKQVFQISSQTSVQPSTQSLSFAGKEKPKQTFQISSGSQINNAQNSLSFEGKPKPKFEIVSNNNISSSSSQGLTFAAKPKPAFQISSNHQGNTSGAQGFAFIAPEKPKFVPVSNGITLGGDKPEIKKSNPSEYKITSSNQNQNNGNIGISYVAPERKKQQYSVSSSSQGISYIAPDAPKTVKKSNNIQFTGSHSTSIQFAGTGVPPPVKKKKKKHYEMQWDSKYKKSDPKTYKIVSKTINLFFEGRKREITFDYIIQQLSQPSQAPNMSVKQFFSKKGRRKGGRK